MGVLSSRAVRMSAIDELDLFQVLLHGRTGNFVITSRVIADCRFQRQARCFQVRSPTGIRGIANR
jgi:hypothetical protein